MTEATSMPAGPPARAARAERFPSFTVAALVAVTWLSAVDRQIVSVLLPAIQKDLGASDAAMALLTGAAFSPLFALLALPIGRLADRSSRRRLIALAVAIWSLATATGGLVTGYAFLLAARIVVVAAEAAPHPPIMSMIGDLAPAHRRGRLIALVSAGTALGFATGGALTGALQDHFGWRVAMLAVGAPGLLLALLMAFAVPEPVRGSRDGGAAQDQFKEGLRSSLRALVRVRSLPWLALGCFFLTFAQIGCLVWTPTLWIRVYHVGATEMGVLYGAVAASAALGTLAGGLVSDVLAARAPRWRVLHCFACVNVGALFLAGSILSPTLPLAAVLLAGFSLISSGANAATIAAYLSVSSPRRRAFTAAAMNVASSGLGGGLAPILLGGVSDALRPQFGELSIRHAMLLAPLSLALGGAMFVMCLRHLDQDVQQVASDSGS